MTLITASVFVIGMLLATYIVRLVILYRGDFEAGARSGMTEVVLKAKARSKLGK